MRETMHTVPLDRPPRPPAGAVTDAVRRTMLRRAEDGFQLSAYHALDRHIRDEHLANARDLLEDVERRYQMAQGSIEDAVARRISEEEQQTGFRVGPEYGSKVFSEDGAAFILLELPDTEFLTAIEHAADSVGRAWDNAIVDALFADVNAALHSHGAPYRRVAREWRFEWIGDPHQYELTVAPALVALSDARLAGPRAEFEEALRKRRGGTPKGLEDAIDEAAKAVESILQVLHHELGVALPTRRQLASLFSNLIEKGPAGRIPPGYVDHLVLAAGGPRNLTSHGQGATVREVPEELADASIAAAATAITLLAHYLP